MKKRKRGLLAVMAFSLMLPFFEAGEKPVQASVLSKEAEWNISRIHAESSYEDSKKLPKIKVALLDSGLDTDKDIPFAERKDFLGETELHTIYQDNTGHGTSVAGVICAKKSEDRICGIAANVDLYAARVLDGKNQAPIDRIVEAIDWAIQKKVNIIHMSFGTKYDSEELERAVQKAYNNNILIVAAAGNDGNAAEDESTIEYPAAYEEVLSVGATNTDNAVTETSSTGEELDVVAPGDRILSIGAFGGVLVDEGTSISAAHVTGVAAVLWGKHPDASNEFIKGLLSGSANAGAITGDCGDGIIDYERSESNYEKMSRTYAGYKKRGYREEISVRRAKESLEKNKKELKKGSDSNYVNGAWAGDSHSHQAETAFGGTAATGGDIAVVKAGARLPDEISSMKIMSKHPCFHGGGYYFSNLAYLFDYAKLYQKTADGKQPKLPELKDYYVRIDKSNDISSNKNIQKEIKNCENDFFKACKDFLVTNGSISKDKTFTNKEKGYALLGAALHSVTDVIAHRGCRKDSKYKTGFSDIIHNRNNDTLLKPEDGIKGNENYYRSELWVRYSKDKSLSASDRKYYEYLLNEFAIADNVTQLLVRSNLSLDISKDVVAAFQSKISYKSMLTEVGKTLQSHGKKISNQYRLRELNENWEAAKMGKKKFKLNANEKEMASPKAPKNVTISIEKKKNKKSYIVVKFPKEKKCRYRLYCNNRADKTKYIYLKGSTGKKNMKFEIQKGKLDGKTIYISVFSGSKRVRKKKTIEKKVVYKRTVTKTVKGKKKAVTVSKTQTVPYSYSKKNFKLKGSIFKLKKKKKLTGWKKKKNAKKISYKPNAKVKFTNNKKLVLYASIKTKK